MTVYTAQLIVTVLFGLLLLLMILYFSFGIKKTGKKPSGPPTVAIVGPSGTGKTSLLLKWQSPEILPETVTSVSPNEVSNFKANSSYSLVDCPGNEKLFQYTHHTLTYRNIKAILFVLDASSGLDGIKESARSLFSVLEIAETKLIPVLIAANKFDLFSALSLAKIKLTLESEITNMRDNQSRTVPSSEEDGSWDDNEQEFLGVDGKPFEFKDLETEVEIIDGSVKTGRINKWEKWLEGIIGA